MKSLSIFVPLLAAAYASAHGFVATVTIDGKAFTGKAPNDPPSRVQSVVRQISETSPIKGANNPDVNCGRSAVASALVANANPGSKVSFDWKAGDDGSNWPHNTGPMITYMASCGSSSCADFDSSNAQWFKIDEVGRNSNGDWVQAELMAGKPATLNLPSTLAPGNYLISHQIIALHLATSKGGAEFYTSCTQLKVGGSQTGAPQKKELVSIPGAYSDNDPGIFDPDVFNPGSKYTFPGPNVAAFVGASDNGSDSSSNSDSGSSSSSDSDSGSDSTTTSTASGAEKTGTCKLKKSSASASPTEYSAVEATVRPRHISRIMRRLVSGHAHSH